MTISIVIPCYNGAPWLGEALASVAAQTRDDWEAVVVDDGSTDDSAAIARQWRERDGRVRLVQQANAGLPAARNAGARASAGDFLVFLDCDDLFEPEFIETMIAAIENAPDLSGCACEQIVMHTDGTRPVQHLPGGGERLAIDDILPCNGWAPHAAVVRRSLFEKIGGFDASLRSVEDWDFWLRALAVGDFAAVRRPLARYRRHDKQMSGNFMRMAESVARVMDGFERRHRGIIERYGRARHHENSARLVLVYAEKAYGTGRKWLAMKLSLMAWRRAPLSSAVAKRIAIMWLPKPLTAFPGRVRK